MPNRILRDWTDSLQVDSLDYQAEVFFVRLVMKADDHGRFHANPKLLRSLCFPLRSSVREADITRWLAQCEKAGMIRLYVAEAKPFLEIRKFGQQVRSRSKFPDPANDINCSQLRTLVGDVFGGGDVDEGGGGSEPPAAVPAINGRKDKATMQEVVEFCKGEGIPESDGRSRFHAWEASGWIISGKPIKCWKSSIRSWREAGYLPSQKTGGGKCANGTGGLDKSRTIPLQPDEMPLIWEPSAADIEAAERD